MAFIPLGVNEIILILCLVIVFAIVFVLVPYWRIFKRAGFSPVLSLLMIVPIANIIMLYYLAFSEWPSLKEGQKSNIL